MASQRTAVVDGPRSDERDATSRLRQLLVDGAGTAGGWPYYAGKSNRLEPTCWAMLALSAVESDEARALLTPARLFLRGLQRADGLLVEPGVPGPNYTWNGLALLADVAAGGPADAWRERLVQGLFAAKGIALPADPSLRQDNSLQAWSWVDGTFSWVEPTAVCLLALKKAGVQGETARARIAEAEAVLLDRMCDGGGWNFGNAEVLGQDLRPYVPTTALALLAMQDRRQQPAVRQSLAWLVAHGTSERATMALSLAAICLQAFDADAAGISARLIELESETGLLGNRHLAAMALYAITLPDHDGPAFRVSA